jgi:RHS repeat-associated protein
VGYIRSPVYVDALVLRDRDSNGDGTLDERLYVAQDANYNVTALLDNSGNVVERYIYDPFGQATVLDTDWTERSGSAFAWVYLHQGGRYDTTSGLYHFRYRDYSPTLGRWTSLDPLGYAAGDVNLYRTVFNAPTVYTDPTGQAIFIPVLVIGGLLVAGAALYTVGGLLVAGAALYTGWQSYQATGNPFDGQIWGAGGEGVVDGAAMIANAATFHQIEPLNNYVNQTIEQNGGAYATANVFSHIGVY